MLHDTCKHASRRHGLLATQPCLAPTDLSMQACLKKHLALDKEHQKVEGLVRYLCTRNSTTASRPSPADTHTARRRRRDSRLRASRGLAATNCHGMRERSVQRRDYAPCAATSKKDGRSSPEPSSRFMFISSGLKERWPVEPEREAGCSLQPASAEVHTYSKKSGRLPSGRHPRYSRRRPGHRSQATHSTHSSQTCIS